MTRACAETLWRFVRGDLPPAAIVAERVVASEGVESTFDAPRIAAGRGRR